MGFTTRGNFGESAHGFPQLPRVLAAPSRTSKLEAPRVQPALL